MCFSYRKTPFFPMYFVIISLFYSMVFLPQINNKRDMIFLNIKIIRVIYPTVGHTGKVTATQKSSPGNRGYISLTAKIN